MQRFSIFKQALISRRTTVAVSAVGLFLFALGYTSLYGSVSGHIGDLINNLPKGLESIFGDVSSASTPEGWINLELFGILAPMIVGILAITFGSSVIGKEEQDRTLELILSTPTKRSSILNQKVSAVLAQSVIISFSVWLGVAVGTLLFEFNISLLNSLWASVSLFLLGAVFGTFAVTAQSVTGKKTSGSGIASALFAVTYFGFIVSKLVDSLAKLKYISPFYYFDTEKILVSGPEFSRLLVLLLAFIIFYLVARISFAKRDTGASI